MEVDLKMNDLHLGGRSSSLHNQGILDFGHRLTISTMAEKTRHLDTGCCIGRTTPVPED